MWRLARNSSASGCGLAYEVEGTSALAYHVDGLGSVRAITDNTKAVVQTDETDEFGVPLTSSGSSSQPFGFTGEQRDPESSFVYLRSRSYDPSVGRFLTRDRDAGRIWGTSSLNRFSYVGNNPILYDDPSGARPGQRPATDDCEDDVDNEVDAIPTVQEDGTYVPAPRSEASCPDLGHGHTPEPPALTRVYEENPKHGSQQRGNASPRPTNGSAVLGKSVSVSENSNRRIGVDRKTGEIVVFQRHHYNEERNIEYYHGYTVLWKKLRPDERKALIGAGLTDRKGRILPAPQQPSQ